MARLPDHPCIDCGYWPGHGVIDYMAHEVTARWHWWAFERRLREALDARQK